jgi:NIPSNAP
MLYEIRTYQIAAGSLAEVEKRFAEGYEHRRKFSEIVGFLHGELGPLNEIVHIWKYRDAAERDRIRAEAGVGGHWPPKISDFIRTMRSETVVPFDFVPALPTGPVGPYFELRYYTVRSGRMPELRKAWEANIGERAKMSPVVFAGPVDHGVANGFVHLWAYKSLDQRMQIRAEAAKKGVWPPPGSAERVFTQETKILMPASWSPLQ